MLKDVSDRRVQEQIVRRAQQLASDPEKQGKPLLGELSGLRSVRTAGQRYRIVFRIEKVRVVVLVVAVGVRREGSARDIYALAQKLVRTRLVQ